jgi:hypothetical protein
MDLPYSYLLFLGHTTEKGARNSLPSRDHDLRRRGHRRTRSRSVRLWPGTD